MTQNRGKNSPKNTYFTPKSIRNVQKYVLQHVFMGKFYIFAGKITDINMSHHRNTLLRMKNVCEIAARYYEPGRADRCYKEVWRRYVYPVYPCCYRTFLNYIGVPVDAELKKQSSGQMSLPF